MTPLIPVVAVAIAVLLGRPSPSAERVILLPDEDGRVGQIVVRSERGEQRLDSAYAVGQIDAEHRLSVRRDDAASIEARYGALLDARPPRPLSFTVNFASGSTHELTPEAKPVLDQLRAAIASHPAPEIAVIGHTDRVGSVAANDELSLLRAQTVATLLYAAGLQAKLEIAGRGEREALVATADEVAEAANRRVEINLR